MAMSEPVHLTDENFQTEVLQSNTPVLVDFWAAWCGPCRMIAPVIEELASEYTGKVKIGKLDVDNNQRVAMQYGIRSIPALLLFRDGKVIDQIIGAVPKSRIAEKLDSAINVN
jgi:thioredoxin 1